MGQNYLKQTSPSPCHALKSKGHVGDHAVRTWPHCGQAWRELLEKEANGNCSVSTGLRASVHPPNSIMMRCRVSGFFEKSNKTLWDSALCKLYVCFSRECKDEANLCPFPLPLATKPQCFLEDGNRTQTEPLFCSLCLSGLGRMQAPLEGRVRGRPGQGAIVSPWAWWITQLWDSHIPTRRIFTAQLNLCAMNILGTERYHQWAPMGMAQISPKY